MSNSVWVVAGRLLARHLDSGARLDQLLENGADQLSPVDRRRCRHLLYGAVRHRGLLEFALDRHLRSRPRALLHAALLLGAFELLEHPDATPAIVHHAVEQTRQLASASEARVVNAVLRRVPATLAEVLAADEPPTTPSADANPASGAARGQDRGNAGADAAKLALRFSHPVWLVERWLATFGGAATRDLLAWNQQPAPVHARLVDLDSDCSRGRWPRAKDEALSPGATGSRQAAASDAPPDDRGSSAETLPAFFKPTRWPGFFLLDHPDWEAVERWIAAGRIYLQDPATALAPGLLDVAPGETVLDLCASPGGKTLQLAEAALGVHARSPSAIEPGLRTGSSDPRPRRDDDHASSPPPAPREVRVVAVDLPGPRLARLRENVARYRALAGSIAVVGHDATTLTRGALEALHLPAAFDAVLIDAPCSNTGVLRHRVEVKWRLRPEDFVELPRLQLELLRHAAALVRPGGRLVYSTCSLEREENEGVVEAFLGGGGTGGAAASSDEGASVSASFSLERAEHSRPWASGCDGAAAFLLRRSR